MPLNPSKPILYLITRGATTEATTAASPEFKAIVEQVSAAAAAGIDLIQLREKRLSARVLFELTCQAVALKSVAMAIPTRIDLAAAFRMTNIDERPLEFSAAGRVIARWQHSFISERRKSRGQFWR